MSQPHSPRESVEDYTLRQRRGESSHDHGDQAGRDGGTKKKDKKETKPDDLQQNEDECGSIQPLLKVTEPDDLQQNEDECGSIQPLLKVSEAAERNPSRTANVLRRLDERRTDGDENRYCEPFQPRPRRPPVVFKPCVFFTCL